MVMPGEYRYRIPPVGLMFSILIPGLIVGAFLGYKGYGVVSFAVTAIFGFGTVPMVRLLGLREENAYQVTSEGLVIAVTSPFGSTRKRTLFWSEVVGLDVKTERERNQSRSRLAINLQNGKVVTIPGGWPGFAEWIKELQKRTVHLGYTWVLKGDDWVKMPRK